jgi:glycosyltransferase involved in cell wall biosynthesis
MQTAAVVPVYNEAANDLEKIILSLKSKVDKIIVVNDGSRSSFDYSYLENKISSVYVLKHLINRGQGAALQTGSEFARLLGADIIIHFDADGQHQAKDIPALVRPLLENKADFVFGSRFLSPNKNLPASKRYLILPLAKLINYFLSGLKLSDAHNGLRAFRADLLPQLSLSQDRMAHPTEYLYLVKKYRINFTEVPVDIIYRRYGQGLAGGIRILKELLVDRIIK